MMGTEVTDVFFTSLAAGLLDQKKAFHHLHLEPPNIVYLERVPYPPSATGTGRTFPTSLPTGLYGWYDTRMPPPSPFDCV
jgi:hypothetical protein